MFARKPQVCWDVWGRYVLVKPDGCHDDDDDSDAVSDDSDAVGVCPGPARTS